MLTLGNRPAVGDAAVTSPANDRLASADQGALMATAETDAIRLPLRFGWVYAAKFLCGEARSNQKVEGPVQSSLYSTAINVHNPNRHPVKFLKKAVLLFDGRKPEEALERPTPPARVKEPVVVELEPDWGLEIDCHDIRQVLLGGSSLNAPPPPVFIKGWVVIETFVDAQLDVVAVYTSEAVGAPAPVTPSLEVDRVVGNRILIFP
jgi:hypothetical protein